MKLKIVRGDHWRGPWVCWAPSPRVLINWACRVDAYNRIRAGNTVDSPSRHHPFVAVVCDDNWVPL